METIDHAQAAYDAMAPIYDAFTHRNDYGLWLGKLLPRLERFGLRTGKLLDVACGTGKAFDPMMERGWSIVACDISPAMVEKARSKYPAGISFDVADMRELPVYPDDGFEIGFELVWALNDAVNYLLGDGDLQLALEAMGSNLADDGLLVFDVNTLKLFQLAYESPPETEEGWTWEGRGQVDGIYESELSGKGFEPHRHRERYRSVQEIQRAMMNAGLEPLAAMGQREIDVGGLIISDGWDEAVDDKIVHVCRRS